MQGNYPAAKTALANLHLQNAGLKVLQLFVPVSPRGPLWVQADLDRLQWSVNIPETAAVHYVSNALTRNETQPYQNNQTLPHQSGQQNRFRFGDFVRSALLGGSFAGIIQTVPHIGNNELHAGLIFEPICITRASRVTGMTFRSWWSSKGSLAVSNNIPVSPTKLQKRFRYLS